jgi:fumarate reductase flavoprotein subunit
MKEMKSDIVVIAAGPSGLAAAIAAAENGMSVIALEKAMNPGGAANMGMGPLGLETSVQKAELNTITVDSAFEMFMNYTHWRVDANLVKKYFEKSGDTISWLQDMGVEFYKAAKYFPGSNPTWHIVKPETGSPGPRAAGTMIKRMVERSADLGVQLLLQTQGVNLIKEDGRITGVMAKTAEGENIHIACNAAIIATGGFGDDVKMIREKTGYEYGKDYFGFRIPGLKGDGIRMAREAGAASTDIGIEMAVSQPGENVTTAMHAAFNQPNLLVNLKGERFFNEGLFENSTFAGNAVNIQPERCGVMVFDTAIKEYYEKYGVDVVSYVLNQVNVDGFDTDFDYSLQQGNPFIFKASTLELLAEQAGIEKAPFLKTVEMYNYYCTSSDAQFGKMKQYLKPVRTGPFYAAKFFPGAYGTLGGIKINHYTEVVTSADEPILGLYAAGTDTCTIYGDSYMFLLPGNTMGYAINTGRMAGENAADYVGKYCRRSGKNMGVR